MIAISGKTTMSACCDLALRTYSRIRAVLPSRSPTVVLIWAMARRSLRTLLAHLNVDLVIEYSTRWNSPNSKGEWRLASQP